MGLHEQIADYVIGSRYSISAVGFRGLDYEELVKFIKIIRSNKIEEIPIELYDLYKYAPSTIEMSREVQEELCPDYNEDCKCHLPDTDIEEVCWKIKQRIANIQRDRSTVQYKEWRGNVFERDGYVCQKCGNIGGDLNAHHIKPWSKHIDARFDIDNGTTLCTKCHRKEHSGEVL